MKRPILGVAVACHVVLATAYALWTPAFEAPDENDHCYYAHYLRSSGSQPGILKSAQRTGRPANEEGSLGHHPPLYYALLGWTMGMSGSGDHAPAWRDNPNRIGKRPEWQKPQWWKEHPEAALYWSHGFDERAPVSPGIAVLRWMRAWSVLFGLGSIVLTYILARLLFPEHEPVAGVAALLLACVPEWSFMHGALDNGNMATALCSAAMVVLVVGMKRARLSLGVGAAFGVLTGLAILTKMTALFLLPLAACVYGYALLAWPQQRRPVVASGVLAVGCIAALAGWVFARNSRLYGDLLGSAAHKVAFGTNVIADGDLWAYLSGDFLSLTYVSAIGSLGWTVLPVPDAVLWGAGVLMAASLLGWIAAGRQMGRAGGMALLVPIAGVAFAVAAFLKFNMTFRQPQGRYLFPAYGLLAVAVAAGLVIPARALWSRLGRAAMAPLLAPPAAAFWVLLFVFVPVFDPRHAPAVIPGSDRPDPSFASMVEGTGTAAPAERATIEPIGPADGARLVEAPTFRWRAPGHQAGHRYSIHLYDAEGRWRMPTYEWAGQAAAAQEWSFPAATWSGVAPGEPLFWKIRRLPDRSRGETAADVAESPPRRLVRVE